MSIWVTVLLFAVGLVLVIKGSDWFIDSAVCIAEIFRVPQIIIGATLVSFGTTLPELFVSGTAAIKGDTSVAFGNAFGSIACNTGLILAIVILVSAPALVGKKDIIRNGFLLLGLMLFVTVWGVIFSELNYICGIILIAVLVCFVYINIRSAKAGNAARRDDEPSRGRLSFKTAAMFAVGAAFVVGGSVIMVNTGTDIAVYLGVPSSVIGFTMLAIGTSLPELVTSVTSVIKKAHGVAIGNILGANILNIVLVCAVSSLIHPIPLIGDGIAIGLVKLQIPLIFAILAGLMFFVLASKKRLPRVCGAVMLALYAVFAVVTVFGERLPIPWIAAMFS